MGKSLLYEAAAICHMGKIRANNEDNLFFDQTILCKDHQGTGECLITGHRPLKTGALFAVFDGMGGQANGELASYIMAEETGRMYRPGILMPEGSEKYLEGLCLKGNRLVCEEMEKENSQIGTTASFLLLDQDSVTVCNIGDSPIYLFRDSSIEEIYEEHTEKHLREQLYGKEAVEGKKFPLSQHIGIFPSELEISPYTKTIPARENDLYLICSDGLSDMVPVSEIQLILGESNSAEQKVLELLQRALDYGGKDNITIILIRLF